MVEKYLIKYDVDGDPYITVQGDNIHLSGIMRGKNDTCYVIHRGRCVYDIEYGIDDYLVLIPIEEDR